MSFLTFLFGIFVGICIGHIIGYERAQNEYKRQINIMFDNAHKLIQRIIK